MKGDFPRGRLNCPMNRCVSGWVDTINGPAPVKRAILNQAASGTAQTLVSAVTLKKIRVLWVYALAGATATNLTFNSASTAISPLLANGANGGEVLPRNDHGWFETTAGEALTVTTGAGATTGIGVGYVEVP